MPVIKSLSEFSRNQNLYIEELTNTREPMYLTRNGSACIVVMDAGAFDEVMAFRNELYEQELRTHHGLLKGYQDVLDGKLVAADKADETIRHAKGWL